MAKRGRKSKYDEEVKPYLEQIQEFAENGATEKEMCEVLNISTSTFYDYKNKYSEFSSALKKGRKQLCLEIRGALAKKAKGFTYEETKQYITEKDGSKTVHTEKYKKYCPPSEAAANMLLKNYDSEWMSSNPEIIKLREQELELKKLQMDKNDEW